MKVTYFCLYAIVCLLFFSCEEVVDIPLNNAAPKLVVDASIDWMKGTDGKNQVVKLTTSTDFYSNTIPTVSGAKVVIVNSSNEVFDFIEKPNTGQYICTDFIPKLNETYTLKITYQNQTYEAVETLLSVPTINQVSQTNNTGFSGKNIELKYFYQDNGNSDDYYLFKFNDPNFLTSKYNVVRDEFFQGNQMFGLYSSDKLEAGDEVEFTLYRISQGYYNYMNKLLDIAGNSGGNPFQTPPATIRGNILNTTQPDNYPYGYFRLNEIDKKKYKVE